MFCTVPVFEDPHFISSLSFMTLFSSVYICSYISEPIVEFYTMQIHAEATSIMHRFAITYIAPEAMNVFSFVHLMKVFEHAMAKVEQAVDQLRRVKVLESPRPKAPVSWLRPSFMDHPHSREWAEDEGGRRVL